MSEEQGNMAQKSKMVVGQEPRREGEYPMMFLVGSAPYHKDYPVYNIMQVHENCGTYGIEWFVAYDKEGNMIGKMNALHVESIQYFPGGE